MQENSKTREVRGRIPRSLKQDFEITCIKLELTQTAAIEEAIKDWIVKKWDSNNKEDLTD